MTETPKRLAPSKETLNLLFALSGNECAFPGCKHVLIDEENLFVAQICHIEAAMPLGERFNELSNNEARRSPENLVLLCYPHHIKTNNISKFPTPVFRKLKADHEKKFRNKPGQFKPDYNIVDNIFNDQLKSIREDTTVIRRDTQIIKQDTASMKGDNHIMMGMMKQLLEGNAIDHSSLEKEIRSVMKWRESNEPRTAFKLFEDIKNEKWGKLNDLENYLVLANTGICYMDLYENKIAAENLVNALVFQPEKPKAMTLAALGYAMKNMKKECEELVEKVLLIDPGNTEAYSALALLYRDNPDISDLLSKIPEEYQNNSEIAFGLSQAARMNMQQDDAIKWAQISVDNASTQKHECQSLLASTILDSIHDPFDVLIGQTSRDIINKANYVIQLYHEAWQEIKHSQVAKSRSWWLINSSVAKKITRDLKGSYEDIIEAINLDASFLNLRHLAISCVELQEYPKAIETISRMATVAISTEDKEETELFMAEVKVLTKDFKEAQKITEYLVAEATVPDIRLNAQYLLLSVYANQSFDKLACELNELMVKENPTAIRPQIHKAKFCRRDKNPEETSRHLQIATELINDSSKVADMHELAEEWALEKQYINAIEIYERITDLNVYSKLTKELLHLYYRAGETKKLLTTCNNLIKKNGPNNVLTEFQCVTYESVNDLKSAINSCLTYLSIYPDDQNISIHLAMIYIRINAMDDLKKVLNGIKEIDRNLPLDVQYKVAKMMADIGDMERFYELSFSIWKENHNKKESHEWFLGISLNSGSVIPHAENPQSVSDDCAIMLEDFNGDQIKFLISPVDINVFLTEEITASNTIAQLAIGKFPGEKFNPIGSDPYKEYTVIEILHKHNYAFKESLRLIKEKFIDSNAFRSYQFGNTGDITKDMKPLHDQLDLLEDSDKKLNELYAAGNLPLGVIASFKNENPISIWSSYIGWHMPGVFTLNGVEEINTGCRCLEQGQGMLIDIISLHTLSSIDLLEELAALPNKKTISQSSVNHLHSLIKEYGQNSEGTLTLGKINGQYVTHRVTKEQISDYLAVLQRQLTWVEVNCEILPCLEAINMLAHEKKEFDDLLEKSFSESILTAKAQGYLLYSEEWSLRSIAFEQHGVNGINTFMLINYLSQKKLLSSEQYIDSTVRLIGLNYRAIPADSSVMLRILEKALDVEHPYFKLALEGLKSDLRNGEQSIATCVNFFYKIYHSQTINDKINDLYPFRKATIEAALTILKAHYSPLELTKVLIAHGVSRCFGNDEQKKEVDKIISDFFDGSAA
jgi:tetratricopeptide (TPR) repeat protein